MAHIKIPPNKQGTNGAKGGRWCRRAEAKAAAKVVRRQEDKAEARVTTEMTEDDEDEFESVEEEIENTISFLVEHHDDAMKSLARSEREERLRAEGFEEPAEDERRANLALNVLLKDWPR